MIYELLWSLLEALVLTIIIEGIAAYIMTRDTVKLRHNICCNLITNPLLNLIAILLVMVSGRTAYYIWLVIGEILVLISEWRLYILFGEKSGKKAFMLSLVTNALSLSAGIILNSLDIL